MSVKIFYDNTKFRIRSWRKTIGIIQRIIRKESMISGDINVIITTDEIVRKINIQFLEHDYYTDVIAFNYNQRNVINGEIYISIDRVRLNSNNYKVSLNQEVKRVIFHGVLHLVGYDDKDKKDIKRMRKLENHWLQFI